MGELNKTGGRDGPAESAVKLLPPISKHIVDLLLQLEHPRDPIALYVFYLYVATWQRTNQPKATTRFCATGLRTTEARIRAAKKMLIKLDLVEDHVDRGSKGRVNGHYIHVKYVRSGDHHAADLPTVETAKMWLTAGQMLQVLIKEML